MVADGTPRKQVVSGSKIDSIIANFDGKRQKKGDIREFLAGLLTRIGVLGTLKRFHETALRVRIVRGAITTKEASQKCQPEMLKDWQ